MAGEIMAVRDEVAGPVARVVDEMTPVLDQVTGAIPNLMRDWPAPIW
ncbi:hypothetical protein [Methylobacterium sp. WL64]|nr:hypothetical protein [Methylobacterium sp. WL64]